jgi:hypothetical protein
MVRRFGIAPPTRPMVLRVCSRLLVKAIFAGSDRIVATAMVSAGGSPVLRSIR